MDNSVAEVTTMLQHLIHSSRDFEMLRYEKEEPDRATTEVNITISRICRVAPSERERFYLR